MPSTPPSNRHNFQRFAASLDLLQSGRRGRASRSPQARQLVAHCSASPSHTRTKSATSTTHEPLPELHTRRSVSQPPFSDREQADTYVPPTRSRVKANAEPCSRDIEGDVAACSPRNASPVRGRAERSPPRTMQQKLLSQLQSSQTRTLKRPATAEASSTRPPARRRVVSNSNWKEPFVRASSPPPHVASWHPPVSPFGLIEEQLYHDPWKLLLACMLLNKTNAKQVRKIWAEMMALIPDARTASCADPEQIEPIIRPLGFHRMRSHAIVAMSKDYLQDWYQPSQLRYIGRYASEAYFMFCRGKWRDVEPVDKDLKKYHAWLVETDGHGSGLQRDVLL